MGPFIDAKNDIFSKGEIIIENEFFSYQQIFENILDMIYDCISLSKIKVFV